MDIGNGAAAVGRARAGALTLLIVASIGLSGAAPAAARSAPWDGTAATVEKKPIAGEPASQPSPGPGKGSGGEKGTNGPAPTPTVSPTPTPAVEESPAPEAAPTASPPAAPSPSLTAASTEACRVTSLVIDANSKQTLLRPGESASYAARWQTRGKCSGVTVLWSTDQPGGAFSGAAATKSPASATFIAGPALGSNWRIVATVTVQPGGDSRADSRFVDVKADSGLVAAAATGRSGETAMLAATLSAAGAPLAGRTVTFAALGQALAATTDPSGIASVALSLSTAVPGTLSYAATFAGDAQYRASSASAALVVTPRDNTPPLVASSVTGPFGAEGWAVGDVLVSWQVTDAESGIVSATGCVPTTVSADTAGLVLTCTAVSAGGTASASVTVKRDATPPAVAGARTAANEHGWSGSDVTVTFSCADALSGVAFCPGSVTVVAEGAAQTVTGTARDHAGNLRSATVAGISIDRTPPTITASRTPAGAFGWNNGDVEVAFECADALSGVASCAAAASVAGEGAGQSVTGSALDRAGHEASVTVTGINIDRTAPAVSFIGALERYDVDEMVAVSCVASDELSGVAWTTCSGGSGPAYAYALWPASVVGSATDLAGNSSTATLSVNVVATPSGLCALTKRFASSSSVGTSLCAQLGAAALADASDNEIAKWKALEAYAKEVDAQTGRAFTAEEAAILTSIAAGL